MPTHKVSLPAPQPTLDPTDPQPHGVDLPARAQMLMVLEGALIKHERGAFFSPRAALAAITGLSLWVACLPAAFFLSWEWTWLVATSVAFTKAFHMMLTLDYPLSWGELILARMPDTAPFVRAQTSYQPLLKALRAKPGQVPVPELMTWLADERVLLAEETASALSRSHLR